MQELKRITATVCRRRIITDDDGNGDDVMIDEGDDVITWNLRRPGGRSTNSSSPRCTLIKLVRFCCIV